MNSVTTFINDSFPGWRFVIYSPKLEYKPWCDALNGILHFMECLGFRREE